MQKKGDKMGDRILCLATFVAVFLVAIVAQKMKNRTAARVVMIAAFLAAIAISAPAAWRFHFANPEAYETPRSAAEVGTMIHVVALALTALLGFMDDSGPHEPKQHRSTRRPTPRQGSGCRNGRH